MQCCKNISQMRREMIELTGRILRSIYIMQIAIMIIIAYLIGSIPSGVWIGKIFFHVDIHQEGSGNSGTTNTFRVFGKKAGIAVLLIDILKGTLAASQPYFIGSDINPLLIGVFASLGHTFSIFDHFKGGKAVATSAGILLAYNPLLFLMASSIFVITLCLSSMASVASVLGITITAIVAIIMQDWIFAAIASFLAIVVILRHRDNFKRIFSGTESMVPFGLGNYLRHKKEQ